MSTNLYIVRTHKIGITNILTALITETLGTSVYQPCTFTLNDRYINIVEGAFTTNFPVTQIRHTVWSDQTPAEYFNYLDLCLQQATENQQVVTIGCHDSSSVLYLKDRYNSNAATAGIYYTADQYSFLLNSNAEYHVYMLKNQKLPTTEHDQELLQTLNESELVTHYTHEFKQLNLIPESVDPVCDYNINLTDLFNREYVINYFNEFSIPLSSSALKLYDAWLSAYSLR
jgi:hypothetical protein